VFAYCTAWTGANDIAVEGIYRWQHSNTNMYFANWFDKEPTGGPEDCVELLRNGGWND
jgi:hypothetical protein